MPAIGTLDAAVPTFPHICRCGYCSITLNLARKKFAKEGHLNCNTHPGRTAPQNCVHLYFGQHAYWSPHTLKRRCVEGKCPLSYCLLLGNSPGPLSEKAQTWDAVISTWVCPFCSWHTLFVCVYHVLVLVYIFAGGGLSVVSAKPLPVHIPKYMSLMPERPSSSQIPCFRQVRPNWRSGRRGASFIWLGTVSCGVLRNPNRIWSGLSARRCTTATCAPARAPARPARAGAAAPSRS